MCLKVKKILVSQPKSKLENSPYTRLVERLKVKIDFSPFIKVIPIDSRVLREQKIKLSNFTAIIFTSKNAIDHFFRVAGEMKYKVPADLRYFCTSEAVASYLQKYVVYRKRRVYIGAKTIEDLVPYLESYTNEKFFLPSSDVLNYKTREVLNGLEIDWVRGIIYKTESNDLSHLKDLSYDILVFFSPSGLESLFQNFPDFKQGKTRIAAFGKTTIGTAKKLGLQVDIQAPTEGVPSMIMALDKYISTCN